MNPEGPFTPEEELEMKVTALLMGQLSAEEAAEVQAKIAADPKLAELHGRLQRAVNVLREARSIPEQPAPAAPVRMSAERREKLLAALRNTPVPAEPEIPQEKLPQAKGADVSSSPRRKVSWSDRFAISVKRVALGVLILGIPVVVSLFPTIYSARESAPHPSRRDLDADSDGLTTASDFSDTEQRFAPASLPAPVGLAQETASPPGDKRGWESQPGMIRPDFGALSARNLYGTNSYTAPSQPSSESQALARLDANADRYGAAPKREPLVAGEPQASTPTAAPAFDAPQIPQNFGVASNGAPAKAFPVTPTLPAMPPPSEPTRMEGESTTSRSFQAYRSLEVAKPAAAKPVGGGFSNDLAKSGSGRLSDAKRESAPWTEASQNEPVNGFLLSRQAEESKQKGEEEAGIAGKRNTVDKIAQRQLADIQSEMRERRMERTEELMALEEKQMAEKDRVAVVRGLATNEPTSEKDGKDADVRFRSTGQQDGTRAQPALNNETAADTSRLSGLRYTSKTDEQRPLPGLETVESFAFVPMDAKPASSEMNINRDAGVTKDNAKGYWDTSAETAEGQKKGPSPWYRLSNTPATRDEQRGEEASGAVPLGNDLNGVGQFTIRPQQSQYNQQPAPKPVLLGGAISDPTSANAQVDRLADDYGRNENVKFWAMREKRDVKELAKGLATVTTTAGDRETKGMDFDKGLSRHIQSSPKAAPGGPGGLPGSVPGQVGGGRFSQSGKQSGQQTTVDDSLAALNPKPVEFAGVIHYGSPIDAKNKQGDMSAKAGKPSELGRTTKGTARKEIPASSAALADAPATAPLSDAARPAITPVGRKETTAGQDSPSGSLGIGSNAIDALFLNDGQKQMAPGMLSIAGATADPAFDLSIRSEHPGSDGTVPAIKLPAAALASDDAGLLANSSLSLRLPSEGLTGEKLELQENALKASEAPQSSAMQELAKQIKDEPPAPAKPVSAAPVPQPEVATSENAFSTFSLNVSDVSFKLAAASLEKGKLPEQASVRVEEFINALDYRDPEPSSGLPLAFASERARHPFAHNRDILRLSVKTAAVGREVGRPLNLVLLLDSSGSMERSDRVNIVNTALRTLAGQLQPQDKLSVISFSRTPRLWADGVSGDKAADAVKRVVQITPEGGTDISAAMTLGYETALKHYQQGSVNRVILLTDGAANLGDVKPASLKQMVERHRKQGVAFDCFGIGWEGYNDDLLEELSRNGDGRYAFINDTGAAATEFAGKLAGALRVAASDVKVQVEFNPKRVRAYRQIGYAKHQLKKEQFRDNTVDAAEIGAAESGNALYSLEVNPRGEGDIATVRVRYKTPGTDDYHETEWLVPYRGEAAPLDQSSPSIRLATVAAAFAESLAGVPYAGDVSNDKLLPLLRGISAAYGADKRPAKLEEMIRQARSISGR